VSSTIETRCAIGESPQVLTYMTETELLKGLRLVEKLADHYEIRAEYVRGIPETSGFRQPMQIW